MLRDEYTAQLLNCTWLKQACKNIGKDYHEDLYQEFWIIFLSFSEDKLATINNLRFFCVRILLNITNDKTDRVLRRNKDAELPVNISDEINEHESIFEKCDVKQLKEAILNKLPMYERCLFRLHENGMSMRHISRETKIDIREIMTRINTIKTIIRDAATHI